MNSINRLSEEYKLDSRVNCWDIMRLDDACKLLVIDPYLSFETRKLYTTSKCPELIQIKISQLFENSSTINDDSLKEMRDSLIKLAFSQRLYIQLNIQYLSWLEPMLFSYVRCISVESPVLIRECNRFAGDKFKGVLINAKVDIPKYQKIGHLLGYYKTIDEKAKKYLEEQHLDFSVMDSSMKNKSVIMLGPASFLNHDCDPNCSYYSLSNSMLCIQTLKDIKAGEELLCYYAPNYFGSDNEECACLTCGKKKKECCTQIQKNSCSSNSYASSVVIPSSKLRDTGELKIYNIDKSASSEAIKVSSTIAKMRHNGKSDVLDHIISQNTELILDEKLEDSYEFFRGFNNYKKLDKKLPYAIVVLERLDTYMNTSSECDNTEQNDYFLSLTERDIMQKRKNGYDFCIYCKEFKTQLPRHLRLMHEDKITVKNTLFGDECTIPTTYLRNQGLGRLSQLTGITIPTRSVKKDAKEEVVKVQCNNCLGHFSQKTLLHHQRTCLLFTLEQSYFSELMKS